MLRIIPACGQLQNVQLPPDDDPDLTPVLREGLAGERQRWWQQIDDATRWLVDNVATYAGTWPVRHLIEIPITYAHHVRVVVLSEREPAERGAHCIQYSKLLASGHAADEVHRSDTHRDVAVGGNWCGTHHRTAVPDMTIYGDDATIRQILTGAGETWALVGLSDNPQRAAYRVAEKLQRIGKRVVPVHPKAETVHGEQGYASLAEIPFPVDVVDVFVNSALAGGIADQAVTIGAKAVWFQLGVIDEAAYERTREAGLLMVMDRSPGREIPRLGLG